MRKGDWYVFCDVCGRRHFASETTKLSNYTGKGGLNVCSRDIDRVDPGLIPFTPKRETQPDVIRVSRNNTDNSAPLVDLELMAYTWFLADSQDGAIITSSQDGAYIVTTEPL